MNPQIPDKGALRTQYEADYDSCQNVMRSLTGYLETLLGNLQSHLTIYGRVKSFESFYKKYIRYLRNDNNKDGKLKIPDEIGIRVICPFLEDIETVEKIIQDNFEILEVETKGSSYSFKEFGYESHHILISIPACIGDRYLKSNGNKWSGEVAEIQVRTILQDAWAEVEHELVYKTEFSPFGNPMKRKLAAINASLSLFDTIFQEIRSYQNQLNTQLGKRRNNFYKQIENSMDTLILPVEDEKESANKIIEKQVVESGASVDDILLNALYAHNKGKFGLAEFFYSEILTMHPDTNVKSVIYKHRGMAKFAQSKYDEAILDFKSSLEINPQNYPCEYYMGVVYSCQKEYLAAIDNFTRSLEINPYQKYCLYRRAQSFYKLDDYTAALSDCEAAIRLDCDFKEASRLKKLLLDKLAM
jgi:putative GTP pyrophosphokinase